MRNSHVLFFTIFFFFFTIHFNTNEAAESSCPINFDYVNTFPWDTSLCRGPVLESGCCQILRNLFTIGLAKYLNQTSMFYFPDANTSSSCIASFGDKIESMAANSSTCFNDTTEFVNNRSTSCAGIAKVRDWTQRVGNAVSTPLESSCNGDLTGLTRCSMCADAGVKLNSDLVSLHPNSTKCFAFVLLYAGGGVNDFGADDVRSASCIFGLPLSRSANGNGSNYRTPNFVGSFVGLCVVLLLFVV